MRCVYFSKGQCYANPIPQLPEMFTPDDEDKRDYCENKNFKACPRFTSLQPAPTAAGAGGK